VRTVYVDRRALRARARYLLASAVAAAIVALLMLGHLVGLLLGAADAYVTSLLGMPRIAYGTRRFVQVVRETWEDDL
jgi:pheromone shutdown protein TraB